MVMTRILVQQRLTFQFKSGPMNETLHERRWEGACSESSILPTNVEKRQVTRVENVNELPRPMAVDDGWVKVLVATPALTRM